MAKMDITMRGDKGEMLRFRLGVSGKNMKLDEKLVEKIFSKQAEVLN